MNKYVYKLGEFSGSDYLEFRKGNSGAGRKIASTRFTVCNWTTRFTFSWKVHFKKSLCHSICLKILVLQEEEWRKLMQLNIPETVLPEFVSDAKETISAIDRWVTGEI
ncbi:MAG: hypothetical protein ACLR1P_08035 [Oscillospiraceae bacterium]